MCFTGNYEIPILKPKYELPECMELLGINYAKSSKEYHKIIHCWTEDYQLNRLWNNPNVQMQVISRFTGAFSPDFSLYRDMPFSVQLWNHYRKQWVAAYWQLNGIQVYPTISWSDAKSYSFCFEGIPKRSVVCVSTVGSLKDKESRKLFMKGYNRMLEVLDPLIILLYGSEKVCGVLEGNIQYLADMEYKKLSIYNYEG